MGTMSRVPVFKAIYVLQSLGLYLINTFAQYFKYLIKFLQNHNIYHSQTKLTGITYHFLFNSGDSSVTFSEYWQSRKAQTYSSTIHRRLTNDEIRDCGRPVLSPICDMEHVLCALPLWPHPLIFSWTRFSSLDTSSRRVQDMVYLRPFRFHGRTPEATMNNNSIMKPYNPDSGIELLVK